MRRFSVFVASNDATADSVLKLVATLTGNSNISTIKDQKYFSVDLGQIATINFFTYSSAILKASHEYYSCYNDDIVLCIARTEASFHTLKNTIMQRLASIGLHAAPYFVPINPELNYSAQQLHTIIVDAFRSKLITELMTERDNLVTRQTACCLFKPSARIRRQLSALIKNFDTVISVFEQKNLALSQHGEFGVSQIWSILKKYLPAEEVKTYQPGAAIGRFLQRLATEWHPSRVEESVVDDLRHVYEQLPGEYEEPDYPADPHHPINKESTPLRQSGSLSALSPDSGHVLSPPDLEARAPRAFRSSAPS